MTNTPIQNEPSTLTVASETVRHVARDVREALDDGQAPGQWKAIVRDLVREAPLASLGVAFLIGLLVARRR
jgi:hypothetical protein